MQFFFCNARGVELPRDRVYWKRLCRQGRSRRDSVQIRQVHKYRSLTTLGVVAAYGRFCPGVNTIVTPNAIHLPNDTPYPLPLTREWIVDATATPVFYHQRSKTCRGFQLNACRFGNRVHRILEPTPRLRVCCRDDRSECGIRLQSNCVHHAP